MIDYSDEVWPHFQTRPSNKKARRRLRALSKQITTFYKTELPVRAYMRFIRKHNYLHEAIQTTQAELKFLISIK